MGAVSEVCMSFSEYRERQRYLKEEEAEYSCVSATSKTMSSAWSKKCQSKLYAANRKYCDLKVADFFVVCILFDLQHATNSCTHRKSRNRITVLVA